MADALTTLLNTFVYDIRRTLESTLEALADGDMAVKNTTDEMSQILDWLYSPPAPMSQRQRLQRARDVAGDAEFPEGEHLAAILKAARSTGRSRGRPRTETCQHAIRALTLHLATPLEWREIALQLKGCNHARKDAKRSCRACGNAIRAAVIRLEKFLRSKRLYPTFPRRVELDKMSPAELERLWLHEQ